MVTVSVLDGIKYGFRLIGYVLGVGLAAGVIMIIGVAIADAGGSTAAFGGLVALFGFLAFYAGMMGIMYKVIADGVTMGVNASNIGSQYERTRSDQRSQRGVQPQHDVD